MRVRFAIISKGAGVSAPVPFCPRDGESGGVVRLDDGQPRRANYSLSRFSRQPLIEGICGASKIPFRNHPLGSGRRQTPHLPSSPCLNRALELPKSGYRAFLGDKRADKREVRPSSNAHKRGYDATRGYGLAKEDRGGTYGYPVCIRSPNSTQNGYGT